VAGGAGPSRLALAGDALDFLWNRWIVWYDLGRQRAILRRAWIGLGRPAGASWLAHAGELLAAALLLAIAAVGLRRALRRRLAPAVRRATIAVAPRRLHGKAPIERLYHRSLDKLRRRGWPRLVHETPHEYANRLRDARVLDGGTPFQELTDRYAAARFGGQPPDDAALAALGRSLAAALAHVRRV